MPNLTPLPGESQAAFLRRVRESQGAVPLGTLGLGGGGLPTPPPPTLTPPPIVPVPAPIVPIATATPAPAPPIIVNDLADLKLLRQQGIAAVFQPSAAPTATPTPPPAPVAILPSSVPFGQFGRGRGTGVSRKEEDERLTLAGLANALAAGAGFGTPSAPFRPSIFNPPSETGTVAESLAAPITTPTTTRLADATDPFAAPPGSAGANFRNLMMDLAIASQDPNASAFDRSNNAQRFQERLRFVNMGFGGSRAQFDSAVVNQELVISQGLFADIVSDRVTRELPWERWGQELFEGGHIDAPFETYRDFLEYYGYEDLGNGQWRRLEKASESDFPVGTFASTSPAQQQFAPFPAFQNARGAIGLVNWRV